MDSLLSTYASSDEEDDQQQPQPTPPPPTSQPSTKASSLFSSLPKPQANSSVFSSLPPPKSSSSSPSSSSQTPFSLPPPKPRNQTQQEQDSNPPPSKSSALFSSLPAPKSQQTTDFNIPPPNTKRVVQFRPPLPQLSKDNDDDDEEDEEEKERKKRKQLGQDASVKSFLSNMPVPKNSAASTLGAGATPSLGSGRRSIIETETSEPAPSGSDANGLNNSRVGFDSINVRSNQGNWDHQSYGCSHDAVVATDQINTGNDGYSAYGSAGSYDNYGNCVYYESGWYNASSGAMASEASEAMATSGAVESFVSVAGKRRKGQVPTEIVEVKQDELIKNRPREDQSKLTGLAFGPSYQPAPSGKGKPNKLAKRKHQIGALYFDMRQKEMELAERRAKGLLTKAETQAKYGW